MNTIKKTTILPLLAIALLGGGMIGGYASLASADTTTDATAPTTQTTKPVFDIHLGGHVGANGVKEELLTGDVATKVTAAATTALPGATIDRVETDAEGATYEAHVTKADGSHVTLKFDAEYNVTATEDGPSHGGGRGHGPRTEASASVTTATTAQ